MAGGPGSFLALLRPWLAILVGQGATHLGPQGQSKPIQRTFSGPIPDWGVTSLGTHLRFIPSPSCFQPVPRGPATTPPPPRHPNREARATQLPRSSWSSLGWGGRGGQALWVEPSALQGILGLSPVSISALTVFPVASHTAPRRASSPHSLPWTSFSPPRSPRGGLELPSPTEPDFLKGGAQIQPHCFGSVGQGHISPSPRASSSSHQVGSAERPQSVARRGSAEVTGSRPSPCQNGTTGYPSSRCLCLEGPFSPAGLGRLPSSSPGSTGPRGRLWAGIAVSRQGHGRGGSPPTNTGS